MERVKLLSASNSLTIHSGNVLYNLVMSMDEICASFCGNVKAWLIENGSQPVCQSKKSALFIDGGSPYEIENRDDVKITLKVFLQECDPLTLQEALDTALGVLKTSHIDSVLLSFPPNNSDSNFQQFKFSTIEAVWKKLESYVEKHAVNNIGVCDFDGTSLQDLFTHAKIKPTTNQINLVQCCTPPDDLAAFAAENEVMLLTHSDPTVILPPKTVQCILSDTGVTGDWRPSYLLRYTCVVKLREIVKCRGYLVKLSNPQAST